jgi:hypothetical protein
MLPRSMEEIGRKGIAKLCRVPTAGCHKQSDLNCTGCKPSFAGRATTESMVRQRIVRQKPLYLEHNFSMAGWSGEDCGLNRLDSIVPSGRCGLTAFEDSLLLLFCLPEPPGVQHGT